MRLPLHQMKENLLTYTTLLWPTLKSRRNDLPDQEATSVATQNKYKLDQQIWQGSVPVHPGGNSRMELGRVAYQIHSSVGQRSISAGVIPLRHSSWRTWTEIKLHPCQNLYHFSSGRRPVSVQIGRCNMFDI